MTFLGKDIEELPRMYLCDCCNAWMVQGQLAVILAYRDRNDSLVFEWHCLECEGVGA